MREDSTDLVGADLVTAKVYPLGTRKSKKEKRCSYVGARVRVPLVSQWVKDGGPVRWFVGWVVRGATVTQPIVTWSNRGSALAGPVCDLTFVTTSWWKIRNGWCAEKTREYIFHFFYVAHRASSIYSTQPPLTARRFSRSLGQWGWETGLALYNDSQSFSLSYRPRGTTLLDIDKTARPTFHDSTYSFSFIFPSYSSLRTNKLYAQGIKW